MSDKLEVKVVWLDRKTRLNWWDEERQIERVELKSKLNSKLEGRKGKNLRRLATGSTDSTSFGCACGRQVVVIAVHWYLLKEISPG